jgi:hypothetical protein
VTRFIVFARFPSFGVHARELCRIAKTDQLEQLLDPKRPGQYCTMMVPDGGGGGGGGGSGDAAVYEETVAYEADILNREIYEQTAASKLTPLELAARMQKNVAAMERHRGQYDALYSMWREEQWITRLEQVCELASSSHDDTLVDQPNPWVGGLYSSYPREVSNVTQFRLFCVCLGALRRRGSAAPR